MYKTEFITELTNKANITEEQAIQVNDIMESHPIIGRNAKLAVISDISEKLGVDVQTAENISDAASSLIAGAIKDKLLHPFGSDRD